MYRCNSSRALKASQREFKNLNFGKDEAKRQPIRDSTLARGVLVAWSAGGLQGESDCSTPELCNTYFFYYLDGDNNSKALYIYSYIYFFFLPQTEVGQQDVKLGHS